MSNIVIKEENILVVEGKDEDHFFQALIKSMSLNIRYQIIDLKGKTNFKKDISAMYKTPGFKKIKKLIIFRDADENDADSAFQSIVNTLKRLNLPQPITMNCFSPPSQNGFSTGVYVFPNSKDKGILEDLCLTSISNQPENDCIEKYFACLPNKPKDMNFSKAKVLAFLASKKPTVNSLGIAAKKGFWDFSHSCFDDLKSLIRQIDEFDF